MITVQHIIILVIILFFFALTGCVCRRNLLVVLMCLNVLMSSVCLFFIALGRYYPDSSATIIALITMIIGTLSTIFGLALWMVILKKRETQDLDDLNVLRDS